MVKKIIKLNTIAHFKGNYIDDNKEEAKERRHLSLEKERDDLFFMKFTSQKRKQLNQVRLIKVDPELVECFNMVSYPVFNRKVKISLTDLEVTNYRYFYVCSLHLNGCLKPEKFTEICRIFKEIWEDKLTPEPEKKIILLKASELKPTNEIPWWVNYKSKDRKEKK
jgi:hypothetical protein